MNRTFFSRTALFILMLVAFLVPLAMRGARYSLQSMKNNVKDWLPADFPETKELTWFGDHFLGERFVVVTWPGCTEDDERFKLLVKKLRSEVAPNPHVKKTSQSSDAARGVETAAAVESPPANDDDSPQAAAAPENLAQEGPSLDTVASGNLAQDGSSQGAVGRNELDAPESIGDEADFDAHFMRQELEKARRLGDKHGLFATGNYFENWGGRGEKWLLGREDEWYFITPEGELFRWDGGSSLVGFLRRAFERNVLGKKTAEGKPVALLGPPMTDEAENPFHHDPRKLTARYFASIMTGPELLEQLSGPDGPLWPIGSHYSEEEKHEIAHQKALDRLTGTLFGPDGKQTCIILTLSASGKEDLSRVLGRPVLGKPTGKLRQLASQECGISADDLKLGGPPVDNVAIDEEGTITLVRLVGFSLALGLALSLFCFRSMKVTIIVFLAGGISAVTSLAIVYWTRGSVDAVLMSMPSLVYVLGLSGAVHLVNYYRDACLEHGVEGAPERAMAHGWWPCALAAFTTALGLLSLATSNILPIQKFGFYSALGVMATLLLLFFYLPAALQLFPPNYNRQRESRNSGIEHVFEAFWARVAQFVVRRWGWVITGCMAVMLLLALGLPKINTSVQLLKLFDGQAKIIQDYQWMEEHLGKLVPMELVIRVAPDLQLPSANERDANPDRNLQDERYQLNFLERMELADRVQDVVEQEFGEQGRGIVGRAMSAASFAPELPGAAPPSTFGKKALLRRALYRNLEEHRHEILAEDYLRLDKQAEHLGSELWRISLRLGALNDVDYGEFVHEVKDVVEPVLFAYRDRETILRSIAKQLERDQGVLNRRVLFLGAEPPKATQESESSPPEDGAAEESAAADQSAEPAAALAGQVPPEQSDVDQQKVTVREQRSIYLETLHDLMTNAGIKSGGTWVQATDKWGKEEITLGQWTDDQWKQRLPFFDCVVLLGDISGIDADFLQTHSKSFLDARSNYLYGNTIEQAMPTAAEEGDSIQAVYTGVVPVVYKAQRTLLTSLINSIGWAFVMIAAVMMILLRSGPVRPWNLINARGGLLSMIPNVFPVVLIFGAMGHLNIMVDIGSMMTASVAMGVAVDDTIHFLNWFRTGVQQGMKRTEAILMAYRRVATAMTQTTLIGGLGLSVFAFSTFTPTQRFGVLMLALLAAALVGDLVFLPAMLASPLGKYFSPKPKRQPPPEPSQESSAAASGAIVAGPLPHVQNRGDRPAALRHDNRHF